MEVVDQSVRAPEAKRGGIILIGAFGAGSLFFSIAAEMDRVRLFHLQTVESGRVECRYPPSASLAYAIASAVALIIAQLAAFHLGSFSWCPGPNHTASTYTARASVAVVLVAQLLFSAISIAALITSAIENNSLSAFPAQSEGNAEPACKLLDDGLFLTAAILVLFTTVLTEMYYILSMAVKRDLWLEAYSAGEMDGLEMLSYDTSAVRIPGGSGKAEAEDDDDFLEDKVESTSAYGMRSGRFGSMPKP